MTGPVKNRFIVLASSILVVVALNVAVKGGRMSIHRIFHSKQITRLDALKVEVPQRKAELEILLRSLNQQEKQINSLENELAVEEAPLKRNNAEIQRMKNTIRSIESKYKNNTPRDVYPKYQLLVSKHNTLVQQNNAHIASYEVAIKEYNYLLKCAKADAIGYAQKANAYNQKAKEANALSLELDGPILFVTLSDDK